MKFGSCKECNKYKYLEERGMCPTCVESDEWIVYRVVGLSRPKIEHRGLSEKEAKEKASTDKYLFASKEELPNAR